MGITIADVAERVNDANEKLNELLSRTANETVSVFSRVLLVIVGAVAIVAVIWLVLSVILFITNAIIGLVTGIFSEFEGLIQPISIVGGLLVAILLFIGGFVVRGWWNGDSEPIESGDGDTESTNEATELVGENEESSQHEQAPVIDAPPEQTSPQGLEMVFPNYNIVPTRNQLAVNPGDVIEIGVYLSGHGSVEHNNLQFYSSPRLLNEDHPIQVRLNRQPDAATEDSGQAESQSGDDTQKYEFGTPGGSIVLPPSSFQPAEGVNERYPLIQRASDQVPSITLELHVDDAASPGDYLLQLDFTYGSKGANFQSSQSVDIHVNSLVERYEQQLWLLGILIALLILGILALPFVLDIIQII
ncbi:hypothetical protein [Natrinema caseinilyticum]|uniref:hypothetical protein n=1 Tax=Natrinema caseinilyticum TaxID=2961570 RepID=UPI0020C260F9|nr:hypothetical protein [Natrinema caseinilyticum]